MINNKRGGIVTYYAIVGFIFLIWVFGFSSVLGTIGADIVAHDATISGIEAFFFENINGFVLICFLFAFGLGAVLGGGGT